MNRPLLLRIHKYAGLAMAALLFTQALTGTLLLYREPLARRIDPAGMTSHGRAPAISAGAALAAAERALPGFVATRLYAPDNAGATYRVELSDLRGVTRLASVDPAGGRVLRAGSVWAFPVEAALQVHYRLMAGKAGMAVILLNALALLAMAATGLAFWWPGRGRLKKQLAIRWSLAPRLVLRQAHRTLGVLASFLFAFMATTGLLLVAPELIAAEPPAPSRPAAEAVAVDAAVAVARQAFPGSALRDFRLAGDDLIVNFHAPERNPRAVHRAVVALSRPRLVSATAAQASTALWMTVLPLHTGASFGPAGPAALMIAALALIALCLSGPIMWWQARALRRRSLLRKQTA